VGRGLDGCGVGLVFAQSRVGEPAAVDSSPALVGDVCGGCSLVALGMATTPFVSWLDACFVLDRSLASVSAALISLLAGAMLFLRIVLLPFWRGVPPAEFRVWFAKHSGRIRAVMLPLGAASAATSVGATAARLVDRGDARASSVAAAGAVGVVAVTVAVNEPANRNFANEHFPDDETATLLARWARWHDVRVALGLLAAAAAVRALGQR
jgi:predicted permease